MNNRAMMLYHSTLGVSKTHTGPHTHKASENDAALLQRSTQIQANTNKLCQRFGERQQKLRRKLTCHLIMYVT